MSTMEITHHFGLSRIAAPSQRRPKMEKINFMDLLNDKGERNECGKNGSEPRRANRWVVGGARMRSAAEDIRGTRAALILIVINGCIA